MAGVEVNHADAVALLQSGALDGTISPPSTPVLESLASQAVSDPVFRPHHYARYVIEPITFIAANRLSYEAGNVIKYVCREDAKNGLEDLKKARRYLDIMIEVKARRERVEAGEPAEDVWKERL